MAAVSNLANPQTGAGAQKVSTEAGQYIAPVIAIMNADASGTYGVLSKAKVTITNIDEIFGYRLSEAQSVALMNLFRVADTDISRLTNILDSSANVDVSLNLAGADGENFRAMIATALGAALSSGQHLIVNGGSADNDYRAPEAYLKYQAYLDALNALKYDTLANMLGADDFQSFNMTLDMCGGAVSLIAKLSAAPEAVRKTLYTQLPESNTEKYLRASSNGTVYAAENIAAIKFLPFVVGDKVVFVFDVTVGAAQAAGDGTLQAPTAGPAIARVNADGTTMPTGTTQASSASGAGAGGQVVEAQASAFITDASLTFAAPTRRRIALSLMISREAAAAGEHDLANLGTPLAVKQSGAGLCLAFKPTNGAGSRYNVDPEATNYSLMLAAGMFSDLSEELVAVAAAKPANASQATGLPADPVVYDLSWSLADISDGVNWKDVTGCDALVGAKTATQYGRFAFIPDAGNKNEFRIIAVNAATNTWKLQVNAMIQGGQASGTLYYVENSDVETHVSVTANVQ